MFPSYLDMKRVPSGVVSKNDSGERTTARKQALNNTSPPWSPTMLESTEMSDKHVHF